MASKSVMDAVDARLAAVWTDVPIRLPNAGGTVPADGSAFLDVEYPIGNEDQISFGAPGSNVYRETGAIRLVLSIPAGGSLDPWRGHFDALRAAFRGQQFDGVTTWSASPPILNDSSDNGAYFELSCAIPYQFDTFG